MSCLNTMLQQIKEINLRYSFYMSITKLSRGLELLEQNTNTMCSTYIDIFHVNTMYQNEHIFSTQSLAQLSILL